MRKGFKEKLRPSDVYQAPSQDAADILAERLEKLVFAFLLLPLSFKMFLNCTVKQYCWFNLKK